MINRKRFIVPVSLAQRTELEGYLQKREDGIVKNWHTRYFRLSGTQIWYAKKPEELVSHPHGFIDLEKFTGFAMDSNTQKTDKGGEKLFTFVLHTNAQDFYLAGTPDQVRVWQEGISKVVKSLKAGITKTPSPDTDIEKNWCYAESRKSTDLSEDSSKSMEVQKTSELEIPLIPLESLPIDSPVASGSRQNSPRSLSNISQPTNDQTLPDTPDTPSDTNPIANTNSVKSDDSLLYVTETNTPNTDVNTSVICPEVSTVNDTNNESEPCFKDTTSDITADQLKVKLDNTNSLTINVSPSVSNDGNNDSCGSEITSEAENTSSLVLMHLQTVAEKYTLTSRSLQVLNKNMQSIAINLETLRKEIQQIKDSNGQKPSAESLATQSYSTAAMKSQFSSLERRLEKNVEVVLEKVSVQLIEVITQQAEIEKKINKNMEDIKAVMDPSVSPAFLQIKSDMEFLQSIVKYLAGALVLIIALFWYK